ncbi:MAG: ATPase [Microbacterium sp.]|jgi:ABC-type transport system involved in cytochrome c biogenesis ATPase subunit|nr:ATPase [Microbacterium sp.]
MRRIESVDVEGLFGHVKHEVRFRADEPTIILAPNGAGKTHMLRLTAAALALDARVLLSTVYKTFSIKFVDGRVLQLERTLNSKNDLEVHIRARPSQSRSKFVISGDDVETLEGLPGDLRKVAPNHWADDRTGRRYSSVEVDRMRRTRSGSWMERLEAFPEIRELCGRPLPVFIDTWRLDSRAEDSGMLGEWRRAPARTGSAAASRIRTYTDSLRDEIAEARRASIRVTQSRDTGFAARALAAASLTIREASLHERYDRTVERYEALARNGLAVGEAPIPFPTSTTPTVRRILHVFLDDWDRRLEPLIPVNEKLQILREILDSKLAPSGKRTNVSASGELEFLSSNDRKLPVARLSSGEQHLVALFTLLLFAAKPGSLVLIDEPEISLHAAWKHAFLVDISRVASVNDLQVVLATHSAGIVNGRWDLTEELELPIDIGEEVDVHDDGEDDLDD